MTIDPARVRELASQRVAMPYAVPVDLTGVHRMAEVFGWVEPSAADPVPWSWLPYLLRRRPDSLADRRPPSPLPELGSVVNGGLRVVPRQPVRVGELIEVSEQIDAVRVKPGREQTLTMVTTHKRLTRDGSPCADYYQTAIFRAGHDPGGRDPGGRDPGGAAHAALAPTQPPAPQSTQPVVEPMVPTLAGAAELAPGRRLGRVSWPGVTRTQLAYYCAAAGVVDPIHYDLRTAAAHGFADVVVNGSYRSGAAEWALRLLWPETTVEEFDCRHRAPLLAAQPFEATVDLVAVAGGEVTVRLTHQAAEAVLDRCDIRLSGARGV